MDKQQADCLWFEIMSMLTFELHPSARFCQDFCFDEVHGSLTGHPDTDALTLQL